MHVIAQENQQLCRASYVTISYISVQVSSLLVVKRVAVTFVEVSCVLGFCCWLTPITPTVLCVSTCSDGLLDFHRVCKIWIAFMNEDISIEMHNVFKNC